MRPPLAILRDSVRAASAAGCAAGLVAAGEATAAGVMAGVAAGEAAGLVAAAVVAAGVVALSIEDASARRLTSGRSQLVSTTTRVIERRPLVGVGLGGQPLATREVVGPGAPVPRYTSHTTPLTVAAELGLIGFAAYLGLLAGAALALVRVGRLHATLALALGAILLALVVHSLFYSGFYEDPITWGVLAVAASFLATRRIATA